MATARPLEGKVAIVTGGVRRLGKGMALAFAQDGASVVINARSSRDEAEKAAAEVEAAGAKAMVYLADVTDEAAVNKMVDATVAKFGRVDILVNNAAYRAEAPFLEMSYKQWRDILGIILDGAFLCSRAVLPHMVKNKFGRIINLGGVSSHLGAAGRQHVGAAKSGIVGFTRSLSAEFAPLGITVNCIAPGRIGGQRSATSGHGIGGNPPVGREGNFDDVAAVARLLCGPDSGFISGQTIHVNGGMFMP
ncbi:MAG TPA: SDR family oxidoreductase [Xanthobacteraceae bacterium]|nr:SDR family oxidoreductase [Xanthobacteraceae bacterium]